LLIAPAYCKPGVCSESRNSIKQLANKTASTFAWKIIRILRIL
jgi:hypothetical protein